MAALVEPTVAVLGVAAAKVEVPIEGTVERSRIQTERRMKMSCPGKVTSCKK